LKWRMLIVFVLVIGLSGPRFAWAHGNDHKAPDTSHLGKHEMNVTVMDDKDMDGMDMSDGHSMDGMDMGDMDMSGKDETAHKHQSTKSEQTHKDSGGDMEGMDMGGGGHEHGDGKVVETPPNGVVLGAFGLINLVFVIVGVWNKFLKRKGVKDGASK